MEHSRLIVMNKESHRTPRMAEDARLECKSET